MSITPSNRHKVSVVLNNSVVEVFCPNFAIPCLFNFVKSSALHNFLCYAVEKKTPKILRGCRDAEDHQLYTLSSHCLVEDIAVQNVCGKIT